ncbi:phosphonate C-P lyase system protein PhnH [Thioclava sp. L04-15]|uniref:phosphonate C-P lyase system protein PhnH n=1 Tax=Thioclava sp. L04-15 TaxID=1915318 RepID=UPI00099656E0|nr:phosphonate C-P lyase system protein PhnH [Thioclava sp. L04-15]OOY27281.1 phosphonate C-P lyase system protein PhnH [Thioclava sp. L04-15]TNE93637.1 MAG: phosphonate C-P lyase system protein PhnH [Paracoccaceae bacterium]
MSDLSGGFTQAPQQSARAFRAVLEAMARPGRVQVLDGAAPPAPLSPAAGAVLLTLVDQSTRLYLAPSHDTPEIRHWIAFHCGAPLVEADAADFALGTWEALQPVARFAIGTPDYPDRSATLIVECDALAPANARLTGPGIETEALAHLPEIAAFAANRAGFPLGFDCLFTAQDQVLGLPRSTEVEAI